MSEINIAILTPSRISYSETFIDAHRKYLKGNTFLYYGSIENKILEGVGNLRKTRKEYLFRGLRILKNESYNWYLDQFLIKSFKENRINVVLAEYGDTAQAYLPLIRKLKLPLIVHFHGYDASIYEMFEITDNYKEIFKAAAYVLVVSKKMRKKLLDLGCPEDKLIYNVCGPREEFLKLNASYLKPQFIAAGRFVDKKAPYNLILSFRLVVKDYPEAKLIMAGKGELLNVCRNLVRYYKLENNIHFAGVLSSKELGELFEESLAFVQHSVISANGDEEGTPLTVLEASGAGLPVIATNHGGIPDVIQDEITGFIVEEHDIDEMAKRMIRLLKTPGLAKKLGINGKENIKKNFTIRRHLDVLDDLIEKVIKKQ